MVFVVLDNREEVPNFLTLFMDFVPRIIILTRSKVIKRGSKWSIGFDDLFEAEVGALLEDGIEKLLEVFRVSGFFCKCWKELVSHCCGDLISSAVKDEVEEDFVADHGRLWSQLVENAIVELVELAFIVLPVEHIV